MKIQQRRSATLTFGKAATSWPAWADMMNTSKLPIIAVALACAALLGCAAERPQSTTTPGLETGITSSNGGGQRTLGNQPSIGVTTGVGPTR